MLPTAADCLCITMSPPDMELKLLRYAWKNSEIIENSILPFPSLVSMEP